MFIVVNVFHLMSLVFVVVVVVVVVVVCMCWRFIVQCYLQGFDTAAVNVEII